MLEASTLSQGVSLSHRLLSSCIQVITVADDHRTEVDFVIRRMEVVLDNILGHTALRAGAPTLALPFTILRPMPAALVPTLMTKRKTKHRTFQAWRKCIKEKTRRRPSRPWADEGLFNQLQLSGHVVISENAMSVSLMTTFLVVAVDNQMVDACVAYYEEVVKCRAQFHQDMQELRKDVMGVGRRPVLPLQETRTLQRRDTETERQRFVLHGDFGLGCVRVCCSVDGKRLSTISATNAKGKIEYQGGQMNSQQATLKVEDILVRPTHTFLTQLR